MESLEKQLKDAARAHRPERERILARVEQGMFEPDPVRFRGRRPHRFGPWLRAVGATAVVAGACAAGGYAVASAVQDHRPQQTVATSPSPDETATTAGPSSPTPHASTSTQPSHHAVPPARTPATTPGRTPSGTPHSASPPAAPGAGELWADGSLDPDSNDYWAQSDITFKNRAPLSALTVELRVAQTGGVVDTGNWRDLPVDDFTVSVHEDDGFLVYRWTLKDGRTVPAGQHVFAGQYNHAEGGRDAKDDTYTVRGTASGKQAEAKGDFA
ncbi:hypothetical protein [Streptomyces sp. NBC_01465]|uniref:hypothetical protein n=1 Tax=Streptomyces sp. NBC_01465 TaxID=2903878 RepID=UPI002E313711|nr:hypothetical protein [Streptomyces sp. NBC_01465]